jgi:hypothetical protein
METLLGLPVTITGWVGAVSILIIGIFSLIGIFDKTRRERQKTVTEETKELITILKEKIIALEDRVKNAETSATAAQLNSTKTEAENRTLRDIIQGRDNNTVEFQKQAMVAMRQVESVEKVVIEQNKILKEQQEDIRKMSSNTERLASSIEELVKQDRQPTSKSVTIKT